MLTFAAGFLSGVIATLAALWLIAKYMSRMSNIGRGLHP